MKIAFSADWHIDYINGTYLVGNRTNRELDLEKQVKFMVSKCVERKVRIFFLAGDLFNKTYTGGYFFSQAVDYLRMFTKEGIEVCIVAGNHEVSESATFPLTSTLKKLQDKLIHVFEYVKKIKVGKEEFFIIPHIKRNDFKNFDTFTSFVNSEMRKSFKKAESPIFIGHFEPKGSLPGSEREMFLGNSRILDTKIFQGCFVFCGHVHKSQSFGKNVYIIGSSVRFNMGEREDSKRFLVFDTETKKVESIPLECQEMKRITIDFFSKDEVDFNEEKIRKYKDKLIGIHIKTSKKNRIRIVTKDIIGTFEKVGAHVVSYNIETVASEEEAKKKVLRAMSPLRIFERIVKQKVKPNLQANILKVGREVMENVK